MHKLTLQEDNLTITSYGGGIAYLVERDDGTAFHLQGDDANEFRVMWDSFEPSLTYPSFSTLLDAHGYALFGLEHC